MALVVIKFSLKIRLILKSNFVLKSYHSYCFCPLSYFLHLGTNDSTCIKGVYNAFHAHVA